MDADVLGQHRRADMPPGDDRAGTDDRLVGVATLDELRRRGRPERRRDDRPLAVVQVEDRVDAHEVHVRLVVGVDRAHVLPVAPIPLGLPRDLVGAEVVDVRQSLRGQRRDDVAAHVVDGRIVSGVGACSASSSQSAGEARSCPWRRSSSSASIPGRLGGSAGFSQEPAVMLGRVRRLLRTTPNWQAAQRAFVQGYEAGQNVASGRHEKHGQHSRGKDGEQRVDEPHGGS